MLAPDRVTKQGALHSSGSDAVWPKHPRTKPEVTYGILRVNPRTTSHEGPGSPLHGGSGEAQAQANHLISLLCSRKFSVNTSPLAH